MNSMSLCRKNPRLLLAMAVLSLASPGMAQDKPETSAPASAATSTDPAGPAEKVFTDLADKALLAMRQRAEALKIKGVALVAYAPGQEVQGWISKMAVVGQLKSQSAATNDPGSNLLAIAYSKASEMADTLKPSGSGARPPLKGEFGWQGGWIVPCKTGYLIGAFSGGRSDQDVQVSKTGLAVFAGAL
jgi:hypothetical protein